MEHLTRIIMNPDFGARIGTLYDLYTKKDTEGMAADSILTFLFDEVPLPENKHDVGRAKNVDPNGFEYPSTIADDGEEE